MRKLIVLFVLLIVAIPLTIAKGAEFMKFQQLKQQVLYPVVLVLDRRYGYGSGIVVAVDAKNGYSLIVTSQHVVDHNENIFDDVQVTLYPDNKNYPASLVMFSKSMDLALLRVNVVHPYVAKLTPNKLSIFQPIIRVGVSTLMHPYPVYGQVTEYGSRTMYTNASCYMGDSGGGLFAKFKTKGEDGKITGEDYYLVGQTTLIASATHICGGYNAKAIQFFLATGG